MPQEPLFFFINKCEWDDLQQSRSERNFSGLQWTNVIAAGLRTIHGYCSFAFKRHTLKRLTSERKCPIFTCTGYCTFTDCTVGVKVTVTSETTLKADVIFTGTMKHSNKEIKCRPIRSKTRKNLEKNLQTKLPRSLYLENLQNMDEKVFQSGCRDEAPGPKVLKNIACTERKKARPNSNEILSLQQIVNDQRGTDSDVLQRIILVPKGVMLWSRRTLYKFHERCKEDIVYIDATGSIIRRDNNKTFYVYELVIRNPTKGGSPLPIATFLTCDHTTASITYFLYSFITDAKRLFGHKVHQRPVMFICDGSLVLLQSLSITFCCKSLESLLLVYFDVVTGKYSKEKFEFPILHRCLSHVMKNAKDLCKKTYVFKNYELM